MTWPEEKLLGASVEVKRVPVVRGFIGKTVLIYTMQRDVW